jgi:hypothetical protein
LERERLVDLRNMGVSTSSFLSSDLDEREELSLTAAGDTTVTRGGSPSPVSGGESGASPSVVPGSSGSEAPSMILAVSSASAGGDEEVRSEASNDEPRPQPRRSQTSEKSWTVVASPKKTNSDAKTSESSSSADAKIAPLKLSLSAVRKPSSEPTTVENPRSGAVRNELEAGLLDILILDFS